MTEEQKVEGKRPKERSPSFPYIGLSKAVDRTEALYGYSKRFEARIVDAAKPAWEMGPKSSSTLQTVAALISFGLVEDSGSGENRKIKVSELGRRIIEDERPGAKDAALKEAALKPRLIAEFFEVWGDDRPPEATCLSELKFDRGFTPDGAKAFLRVYDDTVRYAAGGESDKDSDTEADCGDQEEPLVPDFSVGDLVAVEAGGQVIFDKVRIRALQNHGGQMWVFIEGSETGIPMSDVTLLQKAPAAAPPMLGLPPELQMPKVMTTNEAAEEGEEMDRFTVDEGVVKITFPIGMTSDSVDELEQFFQLFIKKAKRRAGAAKATD